MRLATHLHTMRAPPKREGMRTDGVMAATEVLHNEPRQGSGLRARCANLISEQPKDRWEPDDKLED